MDKVGAEGSGKMWTDLPIGNLQAALVAVVLSPLLYMGWTIVWVIEVVDLSGLNLLGEPSGTTWLLVD